jgi:hypothetical protein
LFVPRTSQGNVIEGYNEEALGNIPANLQDQIMTGYSEDLMAKPIPEHLRDEIVLTANPRSAEMDED